MNYPRTAGLRNQADAKTCQAAKLGLIRRDLILTYSFCVSSSVTSTQRSLIRRPVANEQLACSITFRWEGVYPWCTWRKEAILDLWQAVKATLDSDIFLGLFKLWQNRSSGKTYTILHTKVRPARGRARRAAAIRYEWSSCLHFVQCSWFPELWSGGTVCSLFAWRLLSQGGPWRNNL